MASGILYSLRTVPKDNVEETILTANSDSEVGGIIVYYPIYNNRQDQYLQQIVDVSKDVEGLSHRYIFNMYQNIRFLDPETQLQKSILPCTPLAVIKILEYLRIYNTILSYGNRLHGHTICVVNRSEVVGRPLAALLANDGASVYSVDIDGVQLFTRGEGIRKRKHEVEECKGWQLKDCAPLCDVVVTGVPGNSFKFPCEYLREGAVCINFSTEKVRTRQALVGNAKTGQSELWSRSQTKGFHLCPGDWQGHNRRTSEESSPHHAESLGRGCGGGCLNRKAGRNRTSRYGAELRQILAFKAQIGYGYTDGANTLGNLGSFCVNSCLQATLAYPSTRRWSTIFCIEALVLLSPDLRPWSKPDACGCLNRQP